MKIGYVRVSTDMQSTDMQIEVLKAAGVDVIYQDHAKTGANRNRDGLEKALSRLEAGDTLVVYKLDRMARSLIDAVAIMQEIQAKGADFKSCTEHYDTTTPAGKLFFNIMASLAEFEREQIKSRCKDGIDNYRRVNGGKWGRRSSVTDETVKAVIGLRDLGKSQAEIATQLGSVSQAGVSRILAKAGVK